MDNIKYMKLICTICLEFTETEKLMNKIIKYEKTKPASH